MRVIFNRTQDIRDFEKEVASELTIYERCDPNPTRFFASFMDGDIKDGIVLTGVYGDGETIDEAIENYCRKISNKLMVFRAFSTNRIEITTPTLTYEK